jgi:hypothetical protein
VITDGYTMGHDIFRAVGEVTEFTINYIRPIRCLHVYFYLSIVLVVNTRTRVDCELDGGGGIIPLLQILIHSDSSSLCKQENILKISCMNEKNYFLRI